MDKVKVTFEINAERLAELQKFITSDAVVENSTKVWEVHPEVAETFDEPATKPAAKKPVRKEKPAKEELKEEPIEEPKTNITISMLRTEATKLVKKDSGQTLNKIFAQFKIHKLSDLNEAQYAEFMEALEAENE